MKNGFAPPPQPQKIKPKRARRLRVVAQSGPGGAYPGVRDVWLESAYLPHWQCDLYQPGLACTGIDEPNVVDLIRWAEYIGLEVVYEPPGNMSQYLSGREPPDVRHLFT